MTTHISKMLAGPAKSMATEGASTQRPPLGDGITAVRFEGEPAWAIIFQSEKLEMVFGTEDEARAILIQLQGRLVPLKLEQRLADLREQRNLLYNGK